MVPPMGRGKLMGDGINHVPVLAQANIGISLHSGTNIAMETANVIMQLLISELIQQETSLIQPDQAYPVWSPYDAVEAADTMLKAISASKTQGNA